MTDTKPIRIGVREATAMFAREGVIVSDDTVLRMAKKGQLDAIRVGRQFFIDPASIEAVVSAKPANAADSD